MDPASLLVAYLVVEVLTGGMVLETLGGGLGDGWKRYSIGRGKRQAQRDKRRLKTRRGRAWIALRGALDDFWSGFKDGGKDHGRKAWERRKGWALSFGRWARTKWEPVQGQASTEGPQGVKGPEGPKVEGPSTEGADGSGGDPGKECEHNVKQQECPICKGKAAAEGPPNPAPGDQSPAKTPAPSPAGPTSAAPTKGATPVSDSTELTAPKVVDFWDRLADEAQAQVEAEQAAGLDVPGGADVVDKLRSHAGAAHGEFDQMIEAASSTGHQTGEKYRAA